MARMLPIALLAFALWAPAAHADKLLKPNQGRAASINSGLQAVKPCAGAQAKLSSTFRAAGDRFDISWRILAAITKVESDFGCNMGTSSAGAVGWTQFMPGTWKSWGMDADGDRKADPKNSVDAIFSSARYLRVNGAPGNYRKALFAYNHADWYVDKVLKTARQLEDFTPDEFDEMARIARDYTRLEDSLHGAGEKLEELEVQQSRAQKRLKAARKTLGQSQKQLQKAQESFRKSRARLDRATLKYVNTAQGLQAGSSGEATGDQQLLSYVAGSRPQDAVLIYVSARSILERQNLQLRQLRLLAQKAASDQQLAAQISDSQQLAAQTQSASLDQLKVIEDDQQAIIASGKRALSAKARVVRRYAARYLRITGDEGSLLNSPFADLIEGSVLWGGKWRWPVSAPVTSGFGYRCIDVCRTHEGLDLGASYGTRIHPSAPGKVVFAGVMGGYGNMVELDHGNGYHTRYGHMSRITSHVGQHVTPMSTIGRVGCTGHCFGDHLHFEIRQNGVAKNPLPFLPKR